MESEDGEVKNEEIGNNAESLETDLVEVTEDENEQAGAEAEQDEAVEVAEALESLVDTLKVTAANGGLDKGGAQVLALSVNHMYSRVGFGKQTAAVSLESFGGSSSRVGATTLAMEDIKSKIVEIWKAIVAAVKKAIQWVKDYFVKIFGAAQKLEKRAKELESKANGLNDKTAKEKTFDNESLAKALMIRDAVPASFGAEVEKVVTIGKAVFAAAADWGTEIGSSVADEMEKSVDAAGVPAALKALGFSAPSIPGMSKLSNPDASGFSDPGKGVEISISAEMPGRQALVSRFPAGMVQGEEAGEIISKVSCAVGPFKPNDKPSSKATLNTLTTSEASKVAGAVAKLAEEVIGYKAKLDKATKVQERIAKAAEKAGSAAAKEDDAAVAGYLKTLQKYGSSMPRIISNPASSFSSYALKTGKSALDYVEQSLKQYK